MNQSLIQEKIEQTPEQRVIDKAVAIAAANRVVSMETKGRWLVGSQTNSKKWYLVEFSQSEDCFKCSCKSWEWTHTNVCKHVLACAFHEGRNV